ncbi:hypothetical protein JCM10296v2_007926 [Rhodotorula toruloides]
MERRRRDGVQQKVTAILVTNPHNPLGFCYPRHVLVAYAKLAEKSGLYLVSDEMYANSVVGGDPRGLDFVSMLSIDVLREAGCNPSRIIALYGMSKDFGANGFCAGSLVCQHNDKVVSALAAGAMPMRMGSPTDILRAFVGDKARGSDVAGPSANGGNKHRMAAEEEEEGSGRGGFRDELDFLNLLVDGGVYLSSGMSYACPEPGFFRITFSIPRRELKVALERIERVCELPHEATALRKVYPQ